MITEFLENLGLAEWIADAIGDSVAVLPWLFVIFILIELFEYYCADKVKNFIKYAHKSGPIIGSLVSIIPQCGFSVIASTLYVRKYLTMGTLIAIYLATSDEAIPLLLTKPEYFKYILPIIGLKLIIAIPAGYLIDFLFKPELKDKPETEKTDKNFEDVGCCKHEVSTPGKEQLLWHPLKHTFSIFVFILIITLILNFLIDEEKITNFYQNGFLLYRIVQPIITAFIGLIPNCAISLAITVMMLKGTISFGATMAGLLSNAGLGLLVLLRGNRAKNNIKIVVILLIISILFGEILQFIPSLINL